MNRQLGGVVECDPESSPTFLATRLTRLGRVQGKRTQSTTQSVHRGRVRNVIFNLKKNLGITIVLLNYILSSL